MPKPCSGLWTFATSRMGRRTLMGSQPAELNLTPTAHPRNSLLSSVLSSFTVQVMALLLVLALLNYWPILQGEVPLPADLILNFPPWDTMRGGKPILAHHAEIGDL